MGDAQQATPFPTPPPFYKYFTKENVKQLEKLQKEQERAQADNIGSSHAVSQDLRYLTPPAPPANGKWRTFGYDHDLRAPDPTLEEAEIRRLYPDHPAVRLAPQTYLITLARSLLTTFLATCGILAQNPALYEERTKNLKEIVYNMHDLINQYRPHQARESLILMMEEHISQLRQEITSIEEVKTRTQHSLAELQVQVNAGTVGRQEVVSTVRYEVDQTTRQQRQLAAWQELDSIIGTPPKQEGAFKTEAADDG